MINSLEQKTIFIFKFLCIGIIIICARLSYLQIHLFDYLHNKGQKNFLRIEKIVSPRGEITDIHGRVLATNRPIINLYWNGTGNAHLTSEQETLIDSLQNLLEKEFDQNLMSQVQYAEKRCKKIMLAQDVSIVQLGKIVEKWHDNNNLLMDKQFERYYPYGSLASHILGYLNTIDFCSIGKMGIENTFNDALTGQCGTLLTTINSLGTKLSQQELNKAGSGQTIKTTLDLTLQNLAESVFLPDQIGALILMDPVCGDIKALVSKPNFDPNLFVKPISAVSWQELQEKHPFLNRAFNACYPPASLFKLISLTAAIETNLINPNMQTNCKGHIIFGRKYGCRRDHGIVSVQDSLAQSCNILFYKIGKQIDIDTLMQYAKRFGLGQRTGVIFNEKEGLMPTRSWKQATFGEPWWPGDTLQATIGQTYLLVTPIQISCMIGSIFTGYLINPRIVDGQEQYIKPLKISNKTRMLLQDAMHAVVVNGTGKDLFPFTKKGFKLYLKTGTGQTSNLKKRTLGGTFLEHAWSAAYFRYKDEKALTLVVLIENAGSSYVAKTCIKRFFRGLIQIREHNQTIPQTPIYQQM